MIDMRIHTASPYTVPEAPIAIPPMWEALKNAVRTVLVRTSASEQFFYVEKVPGRTVSPWVRPAIVNPDQAWFWTPEWLAGEAEVNAELEAGLSQTFMSVEDFFADLDS